MPNGAEDLRVVALGPYERALVTRRGKPARWLGAGVQQVWTVKRLRDGAPAVTVEVIDVSGVETAPLRDEVKALVPASDYVEAMATEGGAVLRYVDGALDAVLGAGRCAARTARRKVQLAVIEVRERLLQVTGQEADDKARVTTGEA